MSVHDKSITRGGAVGWRGKRATVAYVPAERNTQRGIRDSVRLRLDDGSYVWVPVDELTDPPPMADHVQQAVAEAVQTGLFSNPMAAVYGKDA